MSDTDNKNKSYTFFQSSYPSSDGVNTVVYYVYSPACESSGITPRGIIQISHGMCEYFTRYEPLASYFCQYGFVVCGNDHLGHGATAKNDDELGFTVQGGGAAAMVRDVKKMSEIIREKYPSLPLYLLGHSMGSFIARLYIAHYSSLIDGVIISGTGGPGQPTTLGKRLASLRMRSKGEHYRSALLNKIAFGNYNNKYPKGSAKFAWISRDEKVVEAYMNDKYCQYIFTARGFYDLFDMLGAVSKKKWATEVPADLPVFMISGDMDPVGAFGSGPKAVYKRLVDAGVRDIGLKLYKGARHEILNEINRSEVYADVLKWLEAHLDTAPKGQDKE